MSQVRPLRTRTLVVAVPCPAVGGSSKALALRSWMRFISCVVISPLLLDPPGPGLPRSGMALPIIPNPPGLVALPMPAGRAVYCLYEPVALLAQSWLRSVGEGPEAFRRCLLGRRPRPRLRADARLSAPRFLHTRAVPRQGAAFRADSGLTLPIRRRAAGSGLWSTGGRGSGRRLRLRRSPHRRCHVGSVGALRPPRGCRGRCPAKAAGA